MAGKIKAHPQRQRPHRPLDRLDHRLGVHYQPHQERPVRLQSQPRINLNLRNLYTRLHHLRRILMREAVPFRLRPPLLVRLIPRPSGRCPRHQRQQQQSV